MKYAAMLDRATGVRTVRRVQNEYRIGDYIGEGVIQCLFKTAQDAQEYHDEVMSEPELPNAAILAKCRRQTVRARCR